MLKLVYFIVFEVVVAAVLLIASNKRHGSFTQVLPEITITGSDHPTVFSIEWTGLIPFPYQTGVFTKSGLIRKVVDVTDFSDDAGDKDRADTFD